MRRRSNAIALVSAVLAISVACGDGATGDDDDDDDDTTADAGADAEPGDTVAPELRDVRVAVAGELDLAFGLNTGDATIILMDARTVEITVLVRDDVSAAADVTVTALDAGGAELPVSSVEFDGALWRLVLDVGPGEQVRVRAADEAGNEITGDHALIVPSLAEALTDDWELRFYDENQAVVNRWFSTLAGDGTWTETRQASGYARGGTWSIQDGELVLDERTHDDGAGDADTDETTVEVREVGAFYTDDLYLTARPYLRTEGASGVEGTWTRQSRRYAPDTGGVLVLAAEITDTLVVAGDGSWSRTVETLTYDEGGAVAGTQTLDSSGTWHIELNDDYSQPYGDFFVSTTTEANGEPVDPPTEVYLLHAERGDRLLLAPRIRAP